MPEKIKTEQGIKDHYQKSDIVDVYEQKRFGNIKRSLAHWLDCDAIEYFIRKYCDPAGQYLDLACGTGRLTRGVAVRGFNIVSADYSQEMLAAAQEKCYRENIKSNFVREDAFRLSFPEKHFDGVFTMRFIRHFEYDKRRELYRQLRRVLNDKGYLIFDVLNKDVDTKAHERQAHDETYTLEGITKELRENGFELREMVAGNVAGVAVVTWAKKWGLMPIGRYWAKKYRGRPEIMKRAAYWMVAAQKAKQYS
ncbi:MAG TPA: class I SAM-dependent methyltransferase [Candidatus Omnitrophota bacterium]|nr:class I SAM-dependent methyltransferase [Candidatus Omnitrophota bacterium]